ITFIIVEDLEISQIRNKLKSFNQNVKENSLLIIITGIHNNVKVKNISNLNSPYIPSKLYIHPNNLKTISDIEKESFDLQKAIKTLVGDTCKVVMAPPIPAAITTYLKLSTLFNQYSNLHSKRQKISLQILRDEGLRFPTLVQNYLNVNEYPVDKFVISPGKKITYSALTNWEQLETWYNIFTLLTGIGPQSCIDHFAGFLYHNIKSEQENLEVIDIPDWTKETNLKKEKTLVNTNSKHGSFLQIISTEPKNIEISKNKISELIFFGESSNSEVAEQNKLADISTSKENNKKNKEEINKDKDIKQKPKEEKSRSRGSKQKVIEENSKSKEIKQKYIEEKIESKECDQQNIKDNCKISSEESKASRQVIVVIDDRHIDYVSHMHSPQNKVFIIQIHKMSPDKLRREIIELIKIKPGNVLWMVVLGMYSSFTIKKDKLSQYEKEPLKIHMPYSEDLNYNGGNFKAWKETLAEINSHLKSGSLILISILPIILRRQNSKSDYSLNANNYSKYTQGINKIGNALLANQRIVNIEGRYMPKVNYVWEFPISMRYDEIYTRQKNCEWLSDWYTTFQKLTDVNATDIIPPVLQKFENIVKISSLPIKSHLLEFSQSLNKAVISQVGVQPKQPNSEKGRDGALASKSSDKLKKNTESINTDNLDFKDKEMEKESEIAKYSELLFLIFKNPVSQPPAKDSINYKNKQVVVVIGEEDSVTKFCKIKIPTIFLIPKYVCNQDYILARKNIPDKCVKANKIIWVLLCEMAVFNDDGFTKLAKFASELIQEIGKHSAVLISPITPQAVILPPKDTTNVVSKFITFSSEVQRIGKERSYTPVIAPIGATKNNILQKLETLQQQWMSLHLRIMNAQMFPIVDIMDFESKKMAAIEVIEDLRQINGTPKNYYEWKHFMSALVMFYSNAIQMVESTTYQLPITAQQSSVGDKEQNKKKMKV
ncbi:unnamed protein product, partial [Meganyctiphanes norvegica]